MLRRTVRIACPAVYRIKALQQEPEMSYQQKVREMQDAEMRGKAGPGHRVVTNMIADHHDNDARSSQTKYGKMGKETDGDFTTTKEELRQWMNVKHAAKLLGIPEKKLFALKPDEVTDAFRFEFARATNIRTRTELEAAAELLYEYTGSELLREKTLDHYAETIINAKKEIASDIDKQKSRSRDMMFRGLGFGHLLVTTLFASSIVLMYRYVEEHDAEVAIVRARRVFAGSMCHPVNYEPAPEYQTRYRDTPTCLDELQQQPHRDITDPTHRSLLLEADNATQREEEFLASIAEDVAGEAIRQQRENERQARIDLEKSLRGLGMLGMADSVVERARPRVIRELADGYATFVGEDTATSTPAA